MASPVTVSVQADPTEVESWTNLARWCEQTGFGALLVADHPGTGSSPFVALAAAAGVTQELRLGSYVANAGTWEPLSLAAEIATLDVVSGGRALLGVGAGHTPAEWTMTGRRYPSGAERVTRLIEVVEVAGRLLGGESVTFHGEHVRVEEALLKVPRPVQTPVPLVIGGNGARLLEFAAREADIVAFSGLGRTFLTGIAMRSGGISPPSTSGWTSCSARPTWPAGHRPLRHSFSWLRSPTMPRLPRIDWRSRFRPLPPKTSSAPRTYCWGPWKRSSRRCGATTSAGALTGSSSARPTARQQPRCCRCCVNQAESVRST